MPSSPRVHVSHGGDRVLGAAEDKPQQVTHCQASACVILAAVPLAKAGVVAEPRAGVGGQPKGGDKGAPTPTPRC